MFNKLGLRGFFKNILDKYRLLRKPKFTRRIKKRDKLMYQEIIRTNALHKKFYEKNSFEEWKDGKYWQIRLINKWNAKEFAKKMNFRVAKFYWHGKLEDFQHFQLDSIPKHFIVKPIDGYSSKNIFIMTDGLNLFDGKRYSNSELRKEINSLYNSIADLELIIEEFIPDEEGNYTVPKDYRFYMFNGHIEFIRVDTRSDKTVENVSYYSEDWNLIDKKVLSFSNTTIKQSVPKHFDDMKEMAIRLSKEYEIFVRVDLYSSIDGAVFGELTATPRAGNGYTKYASKRLIKAWDDNYKNLI